MSAPARISSRLAQHGVMSETRPPLPPFTLETAIQKVQSAEDAWNTRDPQKVAAAYTSDSHWRNRDLHIQGRDEIVAFLTRKWQIEQDITGLGAAPVELPRQPDRRPLPIRVAQRHRPVVSQLRQRVVGVRRHGTDGTPRSQHQRRRDRRVAAALLRTAPRGGVRAGYPALVAR